MSEHKRLIKMYHEALDYDPDSWSREAQAASRILKRGFTPEEAMQLYTETKLTKFWRDKHLSLTYIAQQLPAWKASKTPLMSPSDIDEDVQELYNRLNKGDP